MDDRAILVVDDEPTIRHIVGSVLRKNGCTVHEAGSAEEALELLGDLVPAVAMLDIKLPGKSGVALLGDIRDGCPGCEVIMMTSHASVDTAVEAIRKGAFDYLRKPFPDLGSIWKVVEKALTLRRERLAERENHELREELNRDLTDSLERMTALIDGAPGDKPRNPTVEPGTDVSSDETRDGR